MKGVNLDVQAKGDEAAAKYVHGLAKAGEDPRPAFKRIMDELRKAEDPWFASEGGGTWPDLAETTRAMKRRRNEPSDALVATGALGSSLTKKRDPYAVRSATKRQMKFGSKLYYSKFHQVGGDHLPRRDPLIPLSVRVRRRMVHDVRDHLLGRETRQGFW